MKTTRRQTRMQNKTDRGTIQKKYIIIGGVIVTVLLVVGFTGILFSPSQKDVIDTNVQTIYDPPVNYKDDNTLKMLDSVENRKPLSESDEQARATLTALENPLNYTDGYTLEYLSEPNEFMAEITTTDVDQAKQATKEWLIEQGISEEGICKLPLVFYLNANVAEQLRNTNTEFDPLPPGC